MHGIMIQGTASDVGKSLLATALCRLLVNEGYRVAPFKSQNMSNYTFTTADGKEISNAQATQAKAAKEKPTVWMNPILLKPGGELQSELVLLGERTDLVTGKSYRDDFYEQGLEAIKQSLAHLDQHYDVIVMEGAGSPVELNLKDKELVNMKVAELADVPVVLVADIDRGGVFASIIGTLELLSRDERNRVQGIIVNKFRGDLSMFTDGIRWIEEKTGVPVLGVIPFFTHQIEAEDSLSTDNSTRLKASAASDMYSSTEDEPYEEVARHVKKHLDWVQVKNIIHRWNQL
ncbi:MAG TPA: cobyric acid synthase [Bacillota bacterium]